MTIKTLKTAACAGALMSAVAWSGGAFAAGASGDSYDFESGTIDSWAGLSGNGTTAAVVPTAPAVGYPLTNAGHTAVLEIAGTVTYVNDVTGGAPSSNASQVDFMFKVEPTDELEDPSGDDIRVALAVGTNDVGSPTAPIKLWCKKTTSAANAEWVSLGDFTTGSWVRATLVLDYGTTKKCSVSLNGNPALNEADSSSKWFYFANAGGTYVKSITMVGSTMVDDLVVTHTALTNYEIPGGETVVAGADGVTYEYINKYGVTVAEATSTTPLNAASGMTVAEKFVAGLDPKSDTKFELKTMTPVSGQPNKMKVTFPGDGSTYTVTVSSDRAGTTTTSTADTPTATAAKTAADETINEATVTLPADGVGYIHLKATK